MVHTILEQLRHLGPVLGGVWAAVILFTVLRPQRYLNSFLLMGALFLTLVMIGFFFGDAALFYWIVCIVLAGLALLLVPVLLCVNGVQMLRREGVSLPHLLSLGLGLFVGAGEVATVVYVLGLSDFLGNGTGSVYVLLFGFTVFYFSFLVLCFVLYTVFIQIMPHFSNFNYIIIHGCGLAGGERMTKLLSNRVDKAIALYERCRVKPMLIPSGGQGPDEHISEAEAMRRYLVAHGIPEDHILMEDRSATTSENLRFSKALIDVRPGPKRTALVSSNYHVYRCLRLARAEGLSCTGIGADVALYYWPSALIREFMAVFLTRRFLLLSLAGYLAVAVPLFLLLR